MTSSIEISTDGGIHWEPYEDSQRPPEGAFCRFTGGVLDKIYSQICRGVVYTKSISETTGCPVWAIEDILVEPAGSTGDYLAPLCEYQAALKCAEYLSYAGIVMDTGV